MSDASQNIRRSGDILPSSPVRPAGGDPLIGMTRRQKFRLVLKVVELRVRFIALLAGTGLVFGYWDTIWNHYEKWARPADSQSSAIAAAETEYFCPMHPNVVRDHSGNCPICGMPLSKRAKGVAEPLREGVTSRVALTPDRVRQAGIRTAEGTYQPLAESLTTVGEIRFDERRLSRIASRVKGSARVESLRVNFTGTTVKAGEPLAELYSPELSQAVRELLLAQKAATERAGRASGSRLGDPTELIRLTREKLELWGLTPPQIDEILRTGQASDRLPVLSPISGVVVRKNVVEGQYVNEGDSLFEVADLSRLWVQAQVFESQIGAIEVGQQVEATVEAYPGNTFAGTVAFIDPALDPATRTVNVRYDLDNARGLLKPGMFADVTLRTPVARMPAFRDRFAHGRPGNGPHELLNVGLAPKDQAICPVTGQALDGMGGPVEVTLAAGKVWVCCGACEAPLEKDPDRFLARLKTTVWTVEDQKICPVTSAALGSMGPPLPVEADRQKLWICCPGCKEKIEKEPARYLPSMKPAPEDAVLSVPESAVVDTGTQQIVYVEASPAGTFEGRMVVLGPRSNGMYPVIQGLSPGDRVATDGAFLVDAESRLNPVSTAPAGAASTSAPAVEVHATTRSAPPSHKH